LISNEDAVIKIEWSS